MVTDSLTLIHWESLGSLPSLLNLGGFVMALINGILCATSEVRSQIIIKLLPYFLGTHSIGTLSCHEGSSTTLRPPGLEDAQTTYIGNVWDFWLSVSGESSLWVIAFQALDMHVKKPPAVQFTHNHSCLSGWIPRYHWVKSSHPCNTLSKLFTWKICERIKVVALHY